MATLTRSRLAVLLALSLTFPWFFTPPFTLDVSSAPLAVMGPQVDCEDHLCGG